MWEEEKNGLFPKLQFDATEGEAAHRLVGVVHINSNYDGSEEEDNGHSTDTPEHSTITSVFEVSARAHGENNKPSSSLSLPAGQLLVVPFKIASYLVFQISDTTLNNHLS